MKKGISLIVLVVTVVILSTLVGAITFSASSVYDNTRKVEFANEMSMLQQMVDSYYILNNDIPKGEVVSLDISDIDDDSQFDNEIIVNDTINLYEIDYSLLDITSLKYGTSNLGENDKYLVSNVTNKVYYCSGLMIGNVKYYTLTEDLKTVIEYNDLKSNVEFGDGIIISQSIENWTNSNVDIEIKIPTAYTNVSISSANGSVGNFTLDGNYNKYPVTNISANEDIIINYTKETNNKSMKYSIENIDKVAPTIVIDPTQVLLQSIYDATAYLKINSKSDILSGIKYVKYTNSEISLANIEIFFETGGIELKQNIIPIEKNVSKITVAIFDEAGNYSFQVITIDANIALALNS